MTGKIYESLDALKPVRRVLDEAGKALADQSRSLLSSGVPEVLGTVVGIGAGTATGAALISAGAASGTAGAAALTSGLAAAGGLVGGGMLLGVAVVAAPAVLLGIGGFAAATYWNNARLDRDRRALLQEAIRKHEAVLRQEKTENSRNRERADYLHTLVIKLEDVIRNLQGDLGEQAA